MELNGIANIQIILEQAISENTECFTQVSPEVADKILEQLDTLNRYMTAIGGLHNEQAVKAPFWHEVRDNKNFYPNNKGELK